MFWSARLIGVPVRPKRNAFGSASRILRPRSPSWVRWASSTSTMMLLAVVQHAVGLAELVDRRDDDLADVLARAGRCSSLRLSAFTRFGRVRGVEGARDLAVEVDPVDDDHHRRVPERRVQPQLPGGEEHQQRLARALEVPDQALLRAGPATTRSTILFAPSYCW